MLQDVAVELRVAQDIDQRIGRPTVSSDKRTDGTQLTAQFHQIEEIRRPRAPRCDNRCGARRRQYSRRNRRLLIGVDVRGLGDVLVHCDRPSLVKAVAGLPAGSAKLAGPRGIEPRTRHVGVVAPAADNQPALKTRCPSRSLAAGVIPQRKRQPTSCRW